MEWKTGFIGLGQMGRPMARNLVLAGFDLIVYDRDPAALAAMDDTDATAASSVGQLARQARLVFLSLPDADAVDKVAGGPDGLAENLPAGAVLIDLGTTDYLYTVRLHDQLADRGIAFADAPVTGMEQRAWDADLTIMFGGTEELLQKVRPALEVMGSRIVRMGSVGAGQLGKLVNQLVFNINLAALAEIMPLAVKLGLDPEGTANVINTGTGRSFASEFFLPGILENRFDRGYSLKNAYKDMRGAARISEERGFSMPVFHAALAVYQSALDMGLGQEDKGAMIKPYEKSLGVRFRKADRTEGGGD